MRLSDSIESFIKDMLNQESTAVELKRNELADREDEVSAQRRRMIEELDRRMVKTTNTDDIFVVSWQTK